MDLLFELAVAESAFTRQLHAHSPPAKVCKMPTCQVPIASADRPTMAALAFFPRDCATGDNLRCPLVDSHTETIGDTTGWTKV
jgi:hypothetical protein